MGYREDPIRPPVRDPGAPLPDKLLIDIMRFCQAYGAAFWDYIARHYPGYFEQVTWYGDKDAIQARIWDKYKRGVRS
jgi:hypothetical protein